MLDSSPPSLPELIERWERAVQPVLNQFVTDYLSAPSLYPFSIDTRTLKDASNSLVDAAFYYLPRDRFEKLRELLHEVCDAVEQAEYWHGLMADRQPGDVARSAGYHQSEAPRQAYAKEQIIDFASKALTAVRRSGHALDDVKRAVDESAGQPPGAKRAVLVREPEQTPKAGSFPAPTRPEGENPMPPTDPPGRQRGMKEPTQQQFAIYRLAKDTGKTQKEIVAFLKREGKSISQSTVSRAICSVGAWYGASLGRIRKRAVPVEPGKLDRMPPVRDHRHGLPTEDA
jgi:hypothetical protein